MDLPKNPLGLESHVIKDTNIMSPDFHTEGQITCNPFLARLNTDNCWIAKEKVNKQNFEIFILTICISQTPNHSSRSILNHLMKFSI